jgi:flavin reductase (DIM6/NTAB) family NADH-FMN oxidoreductase RutF
MDQQSIKQIHDLDGIARALGRIPSGLFIISAHQAGKDLTMLASWVQQCSFDPPRVTLGLARGRAISQILEAGSEFCISILPEGRKDLISRFGKPSEHPLEGIATHKPGQLALALSDACAWLLCHSHSHLSAGDHDILVADVLAGDRGIDAEGLPPKPAIHLRSSGLRY